MAYHWKNGLYFERLASGSVLITSQPDPKSPASVIGEIPPAEWASIVAAVTPTGENSFTHRVAEKLHGGLTTLAVDSALPCPHCDVAHDSYFDACLGTPTAPNH